MVNTNAIKTKMQKEEKKLQKLKADMEILQSKIDECQNNINCLMAEALQSKKISTADFFNLINNSESESSESKSNEVE